MSRSVINAAAAVAADRSRLTRLESGTSVSPTCSEAISGATNLSVLGNGARGSLTGITSA